MERQYQRLAPPHGADRAGAGGAGDDAAEVERVGALRHQGDLVAARATGVAMADAAAPDITTARHAWERCMALQCLALLCWRSTTSTQFIELGTG